MRTFKILRELVHNIMFHAVQVHLSEAVEFTKVDGSKGKTEYLAVVWNLFAEHFFVDAIDANGRPLDPTENCKVWSSKRYQTPIDGAVLVDIATAMNEGGFVIDERCLDEIVARDDERFGPDPDAEEWKAKTEAHFKVIRARFGTVQHPKAKVTRENHPENLGLATDATETPLPMPADPFESN
jgi:hypothetical protein